MFSPFSDTLYKFVSSNIFFIPVSCTEVSEELFILSFAFCFANVFGAIFSILLLFDNAPLFDKLLRVSKVSGVLTTSLIAFVAAFNLSAAESYKTFPPSIIFAETFCTASIGFIEF